MGIMSNQNNTTRPSLYVFEVAHSYNKLVLSTFQILSFFALQDCCIRHAWAMWAPGSTSRGIESIERSASHFRVSRVRALRVSMYHLARSSSSELM